MLRTRCAAGTGSRAAVARTSENPKICVLALSAIVDDPRVRRQADLFADKGWQVTAVGLPGGRSQLPRWRILTPTEELIRRAAGSSPAISRLRRAATLGWRSLRSGVRTLRLRMPPDWAELAFWNLSANSRHLRGMYRAAARVDADIWLANDWNTLPLAARLANRKGGVYVYDTHEFATEEFAQEKRWRRWKRPLVRAIERKYIGGAAVVSTVSGGIAMRLDRLYTPPRPTLVVRNTPQYEAGGFRPTGSSIRVLYHGLVVPGRGLELAIDSVAQWRPEFELTIRGPENPEFTPALRARIAAHGLQDRVHLCSPVPMTALVREAAQFDIGFFALPGHSRHNEFALPNKIFEYIMAGLCLCTSDLPEIAAIIERYKVGTTIRQLDVQAIARTINGLDRDRIDAYKENALQAARQLCWERESERLAASYGALLQRSDGVFG